MNDKNRTARRLVKARTHNQRQTAKALRAGDPLTAKAALIQRGMDPATAARFASAFSKTAGPGVGEVTEYKPRRSKTTGTVVILTVTAKTFTPGQINAALLTYRPKTNKAAAAKFEAIAYRLAA